MLDRKALRLYLCTDRLLAQGKPIVHAVEEAIEGGVTMVQVREKDASTRKFLEVAAEIQHICRRSGVPLVVNDRIDIALAIGADGVHLGQSDMPIETARRLVGANMFIGISASTPKLAKAAEAGGADYVGVGAIYPTGSKPDVAGVIGTEGLRAVVESVKIPTVAIGGIGLDNAADVMAAGTDGICVISAILSQRNVHAAAAGLWSQVS